MRSKLKIAFILVVMTMLFVAGKLVFNAERQTVAEPETVSTEALYELQATQKYVRIASQDDPLVALMTLREEIETEDKLLKICHSIVHEIGHVAYDKYGSFTEAMQFQDEICNSGYQHGVIESHFIDATDIKHTMQNTCQLHGSDYFNYWQCLHGIGHGLMYFSDNDLPGTLKLCGTFESDFERKTCANGAFMENFAVDNEIHISKYVQEEEWLYPCGEQIDMYKRECYIYAPTYYLGSHSKDYEGALAVCQGAESGYVELCVKGVGSQMIKENLNHPQFVESTCTLAGQHETACIEGMVSLYILHFGGIEEAIELCPTLAETNQPVCERVIEEQSVLFVR